MMKSLLLFSLTALCLLHLPAEDADKQPAAPGKIFDVDDAAGIRKQTGNEITVEGTVHQAFWVRDNVLMITFREEKEGFIAVSFAKHREKLDGAYHGSIAEMVEKKKVRITGKVTEFNNRPQIVIQSPDQIEVLKK